MNKEELEKFWAQVMELDNTVGLNATTVDNIHERIISYSFSKDFDIDELDIEY
jgi:hypothetical protein